MENTPNTAAQKIPSPNMVLESKITSTPIEEKPAVKSYQDEVWISTWKRRSAGLWAGALTGAAFGAAIGIAACLSTVLVGASLAAAVGLMPVIVPMITMGGVATGIAGFTLVGASSGSVAHGLKEQDKRGMGIASSATVPSAKITPPAYNWKVGGAAFLLAGALGALYASTGGFAGIVGAAAMKALGAAGANAAMCASITTFGLVGASFGLDGPKISNQMTNLMGSFLSGRIFKEGFSTAFDQPAPTKPEIGVSTAVTPEPKSSLQADEKKEPATIMTPEGVYAGKEAGFHVRKLAEQQFKTMEPGMATRH